MTDSAPDLLDAEGFRRLTDVSRETLERLEIYASLLRKWQPKINLVGPSTVADLWRRHMLDSAQLLPLIPDNAKRLADMGSGAGFPGLVLAIMGFPEVHLIESDGRKGAFLREVSRETDAPVTLHSMRIEAAPPLQADVVTARALAPLNKLLVMAHRLLAPNGICLFPKGQDVAKELTLATKDTMMDIESVPSATDASATILRIKGLCRA
ncbi:16S rRNA (guanine(527)-N(7))-methyltransferase RsmG [Inquilinus sp. CAU 1745]|uniref:16S rRNA (guanine(527)-N(7))-methyltransferase RsmG n=1 Tax=Inquilinus sp. CAU 1745 TaxID=3140369 RepID=UPI00325C2B68